MFWYRAIDPAINSCMCFDGLYTTLRCVGARSACCVVRIPPAILSRSTNGRSIDHQSLSIVMSNTHKSLLYSLRTSTRTGRHLCFISPISIRLIRVKCPSIAKRNNHNPISGVKSRTNPHIGPNGGGGGGYPCYNDRCITRLT